ncbi:pyridoxamine 5'-phosphate oxidase family protein [Pseudoroseomonas cervicalis]|uniref:pyridoxamine 5'-phosphate oxidase family protein n=1 Tax=Teichococcus cervicalis TaxID=204525 RepID=UPI0022F19A9D|nr:pyridoxamine 5'-phosphate oxidase family protein [Pseudoroseomonas cervicalis]WBV43277.1 pyridoxamine 5'-phosphate oxidase family protein [Pseudoroseomonas cervicalis]
MPQMTLPELSDRMRQIDIAMLSTHAEDGSIASRPMSNNGQVEYRGDSCYFAMQDTHTVGEIRRDPKVSLTFQGAQAFSIAVEGEAEIIQDKAQFHEHWSPDLDKWFPQGIDTAGLAMIKVRATRIHYWNGTDSGEIRP